MRPKLRGDAKYFPAPQGFSSQGNHRALHIPGKHWVEELAPYLYGNSGLAEVADGLPADRSDTVDQLIEMLAGSGFVEHAEADRSHLPSPTNTHVYAAEIAFIDYFCDSAVARFSEFRNTRLAAVGSGLTLTALVAASLAMGLRNVEVLVTGECPTDLDRLYQHLEVARQRDPEQTLTVQHVRGWDDADGSFPSALRTLAAMVHVSDRPMLARARMLDRLCQAAGKVLIQAVMVGDQAWIGPLISSGDEPSEGWESAWRRLQATCTGPAAWQARLAFSDDHTAEPSQYLNAATAALVADHASFEVFKQLTGVPMLETCGQLLRVDLETLCTTAHRFQPHPACLPAAHLVPPSPQGLTETVKRLARGESLPENAYFQQVSGCVDNELGLFTFVDEAEFQQLPLKVCRVTISNPALLPDLDGPVTAIGVGTDSNTARRRAAQRACELYAASVADERRFVQSTDQDVQVWGYDLAENLPRLVPAASIFPTLRGLAPSPVSAPWLTSGFSWAQALATALASVCQYLTVAELDVDGAPFPLVDLDVELLDEQSARYAEILQTWGAQVAVYEVTGALGIPSFAFCSGAKTVAYRTAVNVRDALRGGLEQVVAFEQARTNHQPEYAPVDVVDLPNRMRGVRPTLPKMGAPGNWIHQQRLLREALARQGCRVVTALLDHDPAIADALPYVLNLVVEQR